jgi:hypothetical protein
MLLDFRLKIVLFLATVSPFILAAYHPSCLLKANIGVVSVVATIVLQESYWFVAISTTLLY